MWISMRYSRNIIGKMAVLIVLLALFSSTAAQDNAAEIVFVTGSFYYHIAISSSNGVRSITNEQTYSHLNTPQWSPDGSRIAFTDDKNIYIVDSDGAKLMQLTNYDDLTGQTISNISWSPDGLTIAATLYSGHESYRGYWIRLINVGKPNEKDITSHDYTDGMYGISWSPDGKSIVFTSSRGSDIPSASGLFLLDVKSSKVSALTDISTRRRDDMYPSWSSDGKQIAFVSLNDNDGRWDVYLFDVSTLHFERLTNATNAPNVSGSVFGGTIDWSPDGVKIAFSACPNPYPEGCDLFTIHVDGTNLVQITYDENNGEFDPNWKPNTSS